MRRAFANALLLAALLTLAPTSGLEAQSNYQMLVNFGSGWRESADFDNLEACKRGAAAFARKYAIQAGIGIGLIPDYLSEDETDLVPVLRDVELPTVPIYFVLPEELKTAKKVQVFRDFLVSKARQWKY